MLCAWMSSGVSLVVPELLEKLCADEVLVIVAECVARSSDTCVGVVGGAKHRSSALVEVAKPKSWLALTVARLEVIEFVQPTM